MEVIGKIIKVMNAREGVSASSKNPWKSCEFVVEELGSGYKYLINTFSTNYIDQLKEGIIRSFDFHGNAREYQGRWYNQLVLNRMNAVDTGITYTKEADEPKPAPTEGNTSDKPSKGPARNTDGEKRDLPF